MENYLWLVILIAPGFIAKQTSRWLGNFSAHRPSEFDSIMSYFVYSIFSIMFSFKTLMYFGYLPQGELTTKFEQAFATNLELVEKMAIIIIVSVFVGFFWQVFIKGFLTWVIDKITEGLWNSTVDTGETYLSSYLSNGRDHLLRIKKDGREIAVGRYYGVSADFQDKAEIVVDGHQKYRDWLKYADKHPNSNVGKQCYLDKIFLNFADDFIVECYTCPKHLCQKDKRFWVRLKRNYRYYKIKGKKLFTRFRRWGRRGRWRFWRR